MSATSLQPPESLRILIVEHHRLLAETMQSYLESRGHKVALAANLRQARMALAEQEFHVLITDVHLPDGHCHPFLQEHEAVLPPLVTTMSGYDNELLREAKPARVRRHLVKPFQPEELNEVLWDFSQGPAGHSLC